jgi:hypothetical protein
MLIDMTGIEIVAENRGRLRASEIRCLLKKHLPPAFIVSIFEE